MASHLICPPGFSSTRATIMMPRIIIMPRIIMVPRIIIASRIITVSRIIMARIIVLNLYYIGNNDKAEE